MKWYLQVIRKYAVFSGRARRMEFWMFALFNFIFIIASMFIDKALGTTFKLSAGETVQSIPYGWVYLFYALAMLIPGLAVSVRRLHDTGKSGWMILVAFIPVIGFFWLLILYVMEGNRGENRFGPDPKEVKEEMEQS